MNRVWMIGLVLASLSACGSSDQDKLIGKNVSVNAAGLDLNQIDLANESEGNGIAAGSAAARNQLENEQSSNAASVAPQPSNGERHSPTVGSRAKPQSEPPAAVSSEQANSVEQNEEAPQKADQNGTEPTLFVRPQPHAPGRLGAK